MSTLGRPGWQLSWSQWAAVAAAIVLPVALALGLALALRPAYCSPADGCCQFAGAERP